MFHEVRKRPWPRFEEEAADTPNRPINFVLMLLPFAVYALASGFLDYSSDTSNYTFAFYAFGALIPVIVSGVYPFLVERDSFLTAFVVPLSFLIVVCVPFLMNSGLTPFLPFISIGELGIEVLIFIVPIGFAAFFSLDVLKTYALGRMVYVLFNAVGWYVAQLADNAFGQFIHSQLSLFIIFVGVEVLAVFLIVAIVKAQKSLAAEPSGLSGSADAAVANEGVGEGRAASADERRSGIVDANGESNAIAVARVAAEAVSAVEATESAGAIRAANAAGEAASTEFDADAVASRICAEYGLSQRECDVFALLARGYTSARIQKELYIAAGTVNYHSRNIYAKLGIHSKQELIELFESSKLAN